MERQTNGQTDGATDKQPDCHRHKDTHICRQIIDPREQTRLRNYEDVRGMAEGKGWTRGEGKERGGGDKNIGLAGLNSRKETGTRATSIQYIGHS